MNLLFEEDGAFKTGTILTDNDASLQVETPHGKRLKLKSNHVLMRFAQPSAGDLLLRAEAEAEGLDTEFLWEVCGDDEFAFSLAQLPWPSEEVCPHVLALTRPDGSTIFLLNRGEAVNFVHGAVIGEYVYLVLAEIIEGVHQLAHQASTPGLHELPQATMQRIARLWLTDFHGVTP